MANTEGGRPMHMPYYGGGGVGGSGNNTYLPPRSPFSVIGSTTIDQPSRRRTYRINPSQHVHQRTPSASFLMEEPPLWLDDLLDDSSRPNTNKPTISHRRSASDSFTFLNAPESAYTISNIIEEEEYEGNNPLSSSVAMRRDNNSKNGMSCLVAEIEQLQRQQNCPVSVSNLHMENMRAKYRVDNKVGGPSDPTVLDLSSDLSEAGQKGEPSSISGAGDSEFDSKWGKRNIANRHSAQRSRVRKMQYIAELEATVNGLQAEVSTISPQVAYFDRQRMLLSLENSRLKQRIAILLQDKQVKDVQTDVLKAEAQRSKRLYEIQLQKHYLQLQQQNAPHNNNTKEMVKGGGGWLTSSGDDNSGLQESSSFSGLLKDFGNFSIEPGSKVVAAAGNSSGEKKPPHSFHASTTVPPGFTASGSKYPQGKLKESETKPTLPDLTVKNT